MNYALSYRQLQERLAEVEAERDRWERRARAAVRGEGDRPAESWPDEDAARFLDHERAQRSGEGGRD